MNTITQDKGDWEKQYQSGAWNHLADEEQFVRYAVISSFIRRQKAPLSLLDVGCGEGVMLRYLDLDLISKYGGLDIAQSALDNIKPKRSQDRYICSTLEAFEPDEKWDIILFNEVLYYTADPVALVRKFERALTPNGVMIISMFRKRKFFAFNNQCIRRLESFFKSAGYAVRDAVEVSKIYKPVAWKVYVVKPPQ